MTGIARPQIFFIPTAPTPSRGWGREVHPCGRGKQHNHTPRARFHRSGRAVRVMANASAWRCTFSIAEDFRRIQHCPRVWFKKRAHWSAAKGFKGRRHGEAVTGEDGLDAAFRDFGRVVRPEQVNTRFMGNKNIRASGSEEDGRAGGIGQRRRASKAVAMARQLSVRIVSMPLSSSAGISAGSFDQNRLR